MLETACRPIRAPGCASLTVGVDVEGAEERLDVSQVDVDVKPSESRAELFQGDVPVLVLVVLTEHLAQAVVLRGVGVQVDISNQNFERDVLSTG